MSFLTSIKSFFTKREDVYIKRINEIIERYDYFELSRYNNQTERYLLDEFIDEITKVLTDLRLNTNKMFVLSFISFLYKFNDFEIIKELKIGSNSDKIIKASYISQRRNEKIIIKIQNINDNTNLKDLILIEIISASIFILIGKLNPYLMDVIRKYTIDLGISYVSYYKEIWNYKELTDFTSPNSPYNLKNLKKKYKFWKEFKLCHIYISHFIEGKTLYFYYHSLFFKINPDITLINEILDTKFERLYEFLILLGSKYGHYHGDLHLSNIIYSVVRDELVIIDYGRTTFNIDNKKLIDAINKITQFQIKKLGYIFPENFGYDDIIKLKRKYYKSKNLFIFDIISYSLNTYLICNNLDLYKDFCDIISNKLFRIKFKYTYDFKIDFKFNLLEDIQVIDKITYLKETFMEIRNLISKKTEIYILDGIIFFCLTNINKKLFNSENLFLYELYEKEYIKYFLKTFNIFIKLFDEKEKELLSSTNPLFAYLFNRETGGGKKRRYENSKFKSFLP